MYGISNQLAINNIGSAAGRTAEAERQPLGLRRELGILVSLEGTRFGLTYLSESNSISAPSPVQRLGRAGNHTEKQRLLTAAST